VVQLVGVVQVLLEPQILAVAAELVHMPLQLEIQLVEMADLEL
jgi:hypothetical protein